MYAEVNAPHHEPHFHAYFQTVLAGELYRPLRDLSLFNEVRIDPEVHTLVWPNGGDFDPATLHDWPQHLDALIERARQWELLPAL